jgi:hypothetical protein
MYVCDEEQTQGLVYARQVLYHWATLSAPTPTLKIQITVTRLDHLPELCKLIGLVLERTVEAVKLSKTKVLVLFQI